MKIGKDYTTFKGETVKVLHYATKPFDAFACIKGENCLCWYNGKGECQMWDATKEDNIDFKSNSPVQSQARDERS